MPEDIDVGAENASKAKVLRLGGGSNQARVRDYNERLVLSLIHHEGALARAEIARRIGLSPQAVTIITRALEKDELLLAMPRVRGKVGQPLIPLMLNPDGAFSLGLKIGRRSVDLVLMDFQGKVRELRRQTYSYPKPDNIIGFVREQAADMVGLLPPEMRERVCGLGVATPFELWSWTRQIGISADEMEVWRDVNMVDRLAEVTGLLTFLENDATAACEAELAFGRGREFASFAYFFIGFFIGGGVALNHSVYSGPTGNAGAFGPMPVGAGPDGPVSLIDSASIYLLENELNRRGLDASRLWLRPDGWSGLGEVLDDWIAHTADKLALAIVSACSVIDFEAAIIDGSFPDEVREKLVSGTRSSLEALAVRGISPVGVVAGTQGTNARAVGGARLPIAARYLMRQSVLFNEPGRS